MKIPEENSLSKVPLEKKTLILNYQFAFITFKEFKSAERVVDEIPYFKVSDSEYNSELQSLSILVKENEIVEERYRIRFYYRDIYKFSCFLIENVKNYKMVFSNSDLLTDIKETFKKLINNFDGVYQSKNKYEHLECCR